MDRHQTLNHERMHLPSRRYAFGLAALLVAGAAAFWLLQPSSVPPPRAPAGTVAASPTAQARAPLEDAATSPADFTPDGIPIRPAGSAQVNAEGMVPHPLTPQHERIFRENNLIGNLNGAMDVKDAAGLRALLKQYRDEYPEDAHVLQDGYELIANCLERPGSETRAVAQRYYDEQLDSGLRRYIRRHCLEGSN
jgi:hypothetical protein